MSVLIASKYWICYLSVPKEPPTEANGSRINWSEQSSLLPDTVLLLWHSHMQDRRARLWDYFYTAPIRVPPSFCLGSQIGSDITTALQQLPNTTLVSSGTYGGVLQQKGVCLFLNPVLICGDGDVTWDYTALQEILTRKGISITGIWRDISTLD